MMLHAYSILKTCGFLLEFYETLKIFFTSVIVGSLEVGSQNDFPIKMTFSTIEGNVSVPKRFRKQPLLREILMSFPKVRKTYR